MVNQFFALIHADSRPTILNFIWNQMDKLQFVFPLTFPLHFTSMDYKSRLSTGEECNAMHPRKKAGERAQLGERSSINSL